MARSAFRNLLWQGVISNFYRCFKARGAFLSFYEQNSFWMSPMSRRAFEGLLEVGIFLAVFCD